MKQSSSVLTEQQEALLFMSWLKYKPEIASHILHIANEAKRSVIAGRLMKLAGLKPGASDYFLAIPIPPYHGFWIELKRTKNYTLHDNQKTFLMNRIKKGYAATFSFGADMTIKFIEMYIAGLLLPEHFILE